VCIVPERRQELTTEGGLDVLRYRERLKKIIPRFKARHIIVSLFIEPDKRQIHASRDVGANYIELHTGKYANAHNQTAQRRELSRIKQAVHLARSLGLRVNAGHGLHYQNVQAIARIPEIEDLNIGHSIVGKAAILGMKDAVSQMKMAGALSPSRHRPRSSKRKIS
jgi:pyridoxine 5-phosphate synthase